jgi:D-amino-acid dehydrogenase
MSRPSASGPASVATGQDCERRRAMTAYDAIVVGGGVVGASAAYHLVRQGARTLLVDRGHEGRATDAGAGILSTAEDLADPDPYYRFAAHAARYYPALVRQLEAEGGGDTGYGECGSLTVAVGEDELRSFERARAGIFGHRAPVGTGRAGDYAELSPEQARELFPPLAQVRGAIHCARGARVDGRLLADALRRAALARGLDLREAEVDDIIVRNRAARAVSLEGEIVPAWHVVLAAGAWSNELGRQIGVRIPVEPQRGQIVHLDLAGTDTGVWPIVTAFRGHYMVPWPNGRLVVGATRESGAGFAPRTTVAGVMAVLHEALRVAPGLRGAGIREIRVGLRPASADGLPILGPVPSVANLMLATGHGSIGLQLGPYSGKAIADLISHGTAEVDISIFGPGRFA